MIKDRIEKLRSLMKQNDIDAYMIVTSDYHGSEYVSDYFKERKYMSGFTGSAGTLIVMQDKAALWTDGRYFIQAEAQLKGSDIILMKDGNEGVPDIKTFLLQELSEGQCIGFDGRTVSAMFAIDLLKDANKKGILIKAAEDLPDEIWTDRPELSKEPVWEHSIELSGETREDKLKRVREAMKKEEADCYVLSSLDDIAWLLNLRGNDVECTPVFLAYMIIFDEKAYLYANTTIFDDEIKEALNKAGIEIRKYNDVYANLSSLAVERILLDKTKVNFAIVNSIPEGKTIINKVNPTTEFKAVKNKVEAENFKLAHIKDGVAVTKFMYWLKKNLGKETITELSAAEVLEGFRREQEGYIGPSFDPIFAYGEHGAIVHYSATEESNIEVECKSFLLADTGGHYNEGTTDITRTFVCGSLSDEQKKMYTLVMLGNLRLQAAKFMYGVRGSNLDILARGALWNECLDYNHGTGHGVGNILSVHEGPNSIHWGIGRRGPGAVLEEGMVTSDEPGLYLEGKYGIRLENLILCKEICKNEYGRYMGFDNLTVVPFELEAVDTAYMNSEDIKLLNEYHKYVREAIKPYMTEEENKWLVEATREI